jgi:hypothetical protein
LTEKTDKFKEELELIKNENIRKFAEQAIEIMPDYFFQIPASSTGKYHPSYSLGDGGLLKHSKAVARIAYELFRLSWWDFDNDKKDLLLVAAMLHDGWKSGKIQGRYTVTEHPLIATKEITTRFSENDLISYEDLCFLISVISSHMGKWNKDYKTNEEVLPIPETKYQKFFHLADYLASRRCLEMNFDAELSKE